MSLLPMLAKEVKELWRSYKLLFVPVAFGILGLGQPLAIKLMPQILKNASNLPEGTIIQIPVPPPGMVVAGAIDQLNQMGILLLVLVAMGTVAGERLSGVAATVLTKPVGRGPYLLAKMAAFSLLAVVSLAVGVGLAAYYTEVLLSPVDWPGVLNAALLYLPNLMLAVAVTVSFSAFMPSPLAAGGAALTVIVLLNVVPQYLGSFITRSAPGALKAAAVATLAGQASAPVQPLTGVVVLMAAFLLAGWQALERQEI